MPGLIYYDEIKQALGLPPKAKLSTVERFLRKKGLPFEYGVTGVFTTQEAWNNKIMGKPSDDTDADPIEFFD